MPPRLPVSTFELELPGYSAIPAACRASCCIHLIDSFPALRSSRCMLMQIYCCMFLYCGPCLLHPSLCQYRHEAVGLQFKRRHGNAFIRASSDTSNEPCAYVGVDIMPVSGSPRQLRISTLQVRPRSVWFALP